MEVKRLNNNNSSIVIVAMIMITIEQVSSLHFLTVGYDGFSSGKIRLTIRTEPHY